MNLKTISTSLLLMSVLCGCQGSSQVSPTVPTVAKLPTTLPKVFSGNEIKLTLKVQDPALLQSTKVEVSMTDAIPALMSDAIIDSVQSESKINARGDDLDISIPTTEDFKPGVWNVVSLKFYFPKTKSWKLYKAGQDFAGTPIQIVNDKKVSADKPILEIYNITQAPIK